MSGDVVICAEHVCKHFVLHTSGVTSLKEMVLTGAFARSDTRMLAALDDVSFELRRGRSLGVVGSNGSGKSTLLKLVSGISQPTSGRLDVHGRIAALLELGAGFHLELTGMENIFLQGSLLGMSRRRILDLLDPVLDFCELGDFIHTPMKRYSSGMVVRLGFALAVFFDAETLLVDEVLAVGDSAFQAKCLREVARLRREGRTILFVSHFIPQVEHVADDLLWIEKGRMMAYGSIEEVLPRYVDAMMGKSEHAQAVPRLAASEVDWSDERQNMVRSASPRGVHVGGEVARIESVQFFDEQGRKTTLLESGRPCTIAITFFAEQRLEAIQVELGFAGLEDVRMGWIGTEMGGLKLRDIEGRHTVRARIGSLPYLPGRYRMGVGLSKPGRKYDFYEVHYEAYSFQVRGRRDLDNVSASLPPGRFVIRPR